MDPNPRVVSPGDTLKEAVEKILENDLEGLVVVNDSNSPLGVITLAYLLRGFVPEHLSQLPDALLDELEEVNSRAFFGPTNVLFLVADFFKAEVNSLSPDDPLALAVVEMEHERLGFLPVIEKSRLVGVISRRDIMRVFFDLSREQA
jgi:predicted transcriptional regulator